MTWSRYYPNICMKGLYILGYLQAFDWKQWENQSKLSVGLSDTYLISEGSTLWTESCGLSLLTQQMPLN